MSIYDHKPPSDGGLYLKIEDGKTVKMRIASEPVIYESEFKGQLSTKYAWAIFNQDTEEAQVFQQSGRFFKNLAAYAQDEEWGDPQNYDIKVSREGVDTDTTYTITPSTNRDSLSSEAKEKIKKIDLIKAIEAGRGNQRVMWLSDYEKMAAETAKTKTHAKEVEAVSAVGEARKPAEEEAIEGEVVITDIGDGEVNLDDIPF